MLRRLVIDPDDPDGRQKYPRRHPQLTEDIEARLVSVDMLQQMQNLPLTKRSLMIKQMFDIHVSPHMLRTVYLRNRVTFRKPYVNSYANAYKKAFEVERSRVLFSKRLTHMLYSEGRDVIYIDECIMSCPNSFGYNKTW